jgi:hypothetical protein
MVSGAHPEFFYWEGGGTGPEAIYNLCVNLKCYKSRAVSAT